MANALPHVLVTGSTRGIGAAILDSLQGRARVVGHGRADATDIIGADLSDPAAAASLWAAALDRLDGRIDVLINNAGGLVQRVPVAELTDALFDQVLQLNVRSALMCIAAAVVPMRAQKAGNIINVTSVAARHGGGPGAVLYAGSKGFVSTMTRGLAKELVPDGIRVNAVAPGVITTPFHERFSTPEMLEGFRKTIPMNRIGTADECAGAFLFLASDAMSSYVTGQILEVNGGQYMP